MTSEHLGERWKHDGVRVISGNQLDPNVPSTPGMDRKAAINFARAGAKKLWAGTVTIKPDAKTGAHHHGHLESIIYVVRGKARMRWGERLEFTAEANLSISSRWRNRRRSCGWTQFTAIQPSADRLRIEAAHLRRGHLIRRVDMANPPVDFRLLAGAGVPARDFKAGDVIFKEGDLAQELFIIQSGEVEIRLGNRVLETLPAYSIFGEMALIDNAPRSATAVAASDAKLVPIGEKQFLFLISNTPHFALNVMRVMARRLRAANTAL